ncbi:MAG: hypothetical protein H6978_05195 [Gammaproteobacteria bacterium]|nr:hypothetical protein [Gammaproteobacteria bacterium]
MKHQRNAALAALVTLAVSTPAMAHHGFGRFLMTESVSYSGTLTKLELVNPHSYLYFDSVDADGNKIEMRCEMRAATLIRRSGWDMEAFVPGRRVDIMARPHRDDPHSCYLEKITLGGSIAIDRNDQFSSSTPVDTSNRPKTLTSGEPNISGDWAVEQAVLTIPPSGGTGALVPRSVREDFAAGRITLEEIRARNPPPSRPVYTDKGKTSAEAFRMWSPEDNPRLSCKPTSVIFDWTFDWPVNRITQTTDAGENVIDISYGLYSFSRRVHVGMAAHPANLSPSNMGHSIGHWEGNTLVVDTVGFEEGVLVPPTRNSDQLHVVERYTVDTDSWILRREYTAEDPVYLAEPYRGADVVLLSETPFEAQPCQELTFEFSSGNQAR